MPLRIPYLALAAVFVLAGCGGSPTAEQGATTGAADEGKTGYEEVFAAIEGLDGQARTDKLLELAEAEGGELSLYTSLTSDVEDAVAGAFEDAYDMDVSVYRASSESVLQRLVEEARAGFEGADVVETNGPELSHLNSEGLLTDYESVHQADLVEGSKYEGWTADRFNKFVVSWNTNLVPKGSEPKSWEELADPKWDGKLALELGDVEWYKTLWEYWVNEGGKTEEEADKLFEDMARGGFMIRGHTVTGQLMASGEFAVAASNYSYLVQNLIEDGAPAAWQPVVEPVVSRPNGVGLVKRPKHPATAMLFLDWILSDEGQKVLGEFNLDLARTELASARGAEEIFVDLESLAEEQDEWTERYEQLTQLGEEVEE